ncbi:CdiA family toxin C-terminal domain-containing protein, partial [Hydrogenophaga sp. 5NK40-0174]|uniref:CdiA family toxin C-terminal domain-containing protein n=1 Tax=Hydrogenophaga sp. 5NK40-0174 TaxID=3127649 RepID=UPI00333E9010
GWYGNSQGLGDLEEQLKKDPTNEALLAQIKEIRADVLNLSKLTAAGGAYLLGGDAEDMTLAMATGVNAAENNFLTHQESSDRLRLREALQSCEDNTCKDEIRAEINRLDQLDAWRDAQIEEACRNPASTECQGWALAIQYAASTYKGQYGNYVDLAERSSVLNKAFEYQQAADNPFLYGIGKGLIKLTPPGMLVLGGAGVAATVESLWEKGATQTVVDAVKGIAGIPAELKARLSSDDPSVRGEAFVDVLSLASGAGMTAAGGTRVVLTQAERLKLNATITQAEQVAIARTRIENNVNADGNFAGGVAVRPRDGLVPEGTAQVDTPIGKHLIEAEINFNRKGQPSKIAGGHNMQNFDAMLQANGGQIMGSPVPLAPGIYQVEYRLPGTVGKNQIKTVYDSNIYSDAQMSTMANDAVGKAVYQWNKGGGTSSMEIVEVGGIKFEVPISSFKGTVYVPTAYPASKQ